MPQRLEAAYRAADYVVEAPDGPFTMHVDEWSAALAALHAARGTRCSAFISACNPAGRLSDAAANAAAHARLLQALGAAGYAAIEGAGCDPRGEWPAERSVLVLGIGRAAAGTLAAAFGQRALLHAGADAVPRLVWVDQRM